MKESDEVFASEYKTSLDQGTTKMAWINDLVNETTQGLVSKRGAEVEQRLLAGCNRLVFDDEFHGMIMGRIMGRTVYEVPRWRDRPLVRLKIERARRAYRRGHAA